MKKVLTLCLMVLCSLVTAYAFPKYTTRENAIQLAKVLDKGSFRNYRVASIFVKNQSEKEYYLQAILEDGSKHDWFLDQIHDWVLTDQIVLTDNKVLVFLSDESTEFKVLDKNEFYRLVLSSKAFIKTYPEHDLLGGKNLTFAIRRFQLVQPLKNGNYSTDKFGNRYRYLLDLQNGSREIFTYLDAYQFMVQGAFIQDPTPTDVVLERPFQIVDMKVTPKKQEDELRSIWSFGIEVTFDQPILLGNHLFPIQLIEKNERDPQTGERQNRFFVQILFPNSEKTKELPTFRTLEYLQYVKIVIDLENQKRTFLQAQVAPDVFELPPYVQVTGEKTVTVYFFLVTDQSTVKRPDFSGETGIDVAISPPLFDLGSAYDSHYLKAVELIRSVQGHHDLHLKITKYFQATESLHQAALAAVHDDQMSQAFAQRDSLEEVLPKMVIDNVQEHLGQPLTKELRQELKQQIEKAKLITVNREILNILDSLGNQL